jgi:hypothetical protein
MRKPATFSPNNSKVQPNIPAPPVITSHIIPVRITSRSKSAYDKMNYDIVIRLGVMLIQIVFILTVAPKLCQNSLRFL